jgi:hypothetical protein
VEGLLDEPRPGGPRKITDAEVERVVRLTLETTPRDATHWSTRTGEGLRVEPDRGEPYLARRPSPPISGKSWPTTASGVRPGHERCSTVCVKVALSEPPIFTATAEFCETLRRFVRTGDLGHKRSPLV